MIEFIDKSSENEGTPLDRSRLMGLQGFAYSKTVFNEDGTIVDTNNEGQSRITTFNDDGSITETFNGEKTITKTTIFADDGNIEEVIS
jgi:hypothetical protein